LCCLRGLRIQNLDQDIDEERDLAGIPGQTS